MSFINTHSHKLLFVGRPVKGKGLYDLLYALDLLRIYPWSLTIVGDIVNDETLLVRLESFLPDRMILLGPVPNAEVCSLLNRHDIVIIPSRYENFGQIALEAMACGKAIIAARTGGLKELIINGYNGLHFTPGDHLDLSIKIKTLFDNHLMIPELGKNGMKLAENYSWVHVFEKTLLLLELLSAPPESPVKLIRNKRYP